MLSTYPIKLTKVDKIILDSYETAIDGLSNYLGEGCELVLHSFESMEHSVIKIINGHYSGRSMGAPITDFALDMLSRIENDTNHESLPYFNRNQNGAMLKSTTIPITGENNRIIGLLCINFHLDTPMWKILKGLFPNDENVSLKETFSTSTEQLVLDALEESKSLVYNNKSISSTNRNKEIVSLLYDKGIFNLKDAVIIVSEAIGVSKNTVYMHLRHVKK